MIIVLFVAPTMKAPVYKNSTANLYVQTKVTRAIYDTGPRVVYSVKLNNIMTIDGKKYELAAKYVTVDGQSYSITRVPSSYPVVTLQSFAKSITIDGETLTLDKTFVKPVYVGRFYSLAFAMCFPVMLSIVGLVVVYQSRNEEEWKTAFKFMVLLLVVEVFLIGLSWFFV